MNGTGGEGVRIDRAGGGREMTMATDARKGVSEWPTTSKRRCREGARTGRGTQFFELRVSARSGNYRI